jgi:hypothetical protein
LVGDFFLELVRLKTSLAPLKKLSVSFFKSLNIFSILPQKFSPDNGFGDSDGVCFGRAVDVSKVDCWSDFFTGLIIF